MRQSKRIILNSAVSIIRQIVNMGLRIFLLAFVLRRVSNDAYGVFLLAMGLQTLLILLRDSINKGCLVKVTHCLEEGDHETINKIVSSAASFLTIPAALTMLIAVVASRPVASFFGVGPELQTAMVWIFALAGLNVLLVLPLSPFTAIIQAHQRYGILSVVDTSSRILRAVLIVVLFYVFGANVVFVMVGTLVGDVAMRVATAFFAYRLTPGLRLGPRFCDRRILWSLLTFGSFIVYSSLAGMGASEASKWIIGRMLSLDFVTFLTVAMYINAMVFPVVQAMTLVLVPVASRFQLQGDHRAMGEMLVRGTRYSTLAGAGIMAAILPVITPLLMLWLKPELGWIGPYAVGVGICSAISIPGNCAQQILNGMGDSKRPFVAALAGGVLTIATLVITVGLLDWGFLGVVAAVCIGMLVRWAGTTFFSLRSIPVNRMKFVRQGYLEPILAAIPAGVFGWFLSNFFPVYTWSGLLGVCSLSFLTYVLCFLPLLTKQERQMVRTVIQRIKHTFARNRID